MPLTKCPVCGAEVSSKAQECYRCGTRLHNRGRVVTGVVVLLVGIMALWFIFSPSDETDSPSTVSAPPVEPAPEANPIVEPDRLFVTGDRVNLREGPSLEHRVIRQLSKGHTLKAVQREGDWVEVRDEDDNVGWISREFVGG